MTMPTMAVQVEQTSVTLAGAVICEHERGGRILCYAESIGPMQLRHSMSETVRAVTLHCTNDLAHDGPHQDGICCWNTHTFTDDMATKPNPRDHTRCTVCQMPWPCDAVKLAHLVLEAAA